MQKKSVHKILELNHDRFFLYDVKGENNGDNVEDIGNGDDNGDFEHVPEDGVILSLSWLK